MKTVLKILITLITTLYKVIFRVIFWLIIQPVATLMVLILLLAPEILYQYGESHLPLNAAPTTKQYDRKLQDLTSVMIQDGEIVRQSHYKTDNPFTRYKNTAYALLAFTTRQRKDPIHGGKITALATSQLLKRNKVWKSRITDRYDPYTGYRYYITGYENLLIKELHQKIVRFSILFWMNDHWTIPQQLNSIIANTPSFPGCHKITMERAAQLFYDKELSDLTIEEAAFLISSSFSHSPFTIERANKLLTALQQKCPKLYSSITLLTHPLFDAETVKHIKKTNCR